MSIFDLDLDKLASEGVDVEIVHPVTGERTGEVFVIAGRDSSLWKANADKVRADIKAEGKKVEDCIDEIIMRTAALSTLRWPESASMDGKPLPCTPENALMLYKRPNGIWEQIYPAVIDRASLKKKLLKS